MGQASNASKISLRRLRKDPHTRDLVREVRLSHRQMIQPHFVVEGISKHEVVPGLPGVFRETPQSLIEQVEKDLEKGVSKVLLFGVPQSKSDHPDDFDFTSSQIQSLKKKFGEDLWVGVDVCLCSYTSNGHCGVLSREGDHVDNSVSVERLAQAALHYAQAGADCVAPSDMMDGRVGAIRTILDQNELSSTLIMSYSAKFHSKFYGPFRGAADSAPKGKLSAALKDRATYQIDPARPQDALESSLRDVAEGADILMVKPGLPYLDVLAELSQKIQKPWAVYEVSGEYASIEALAAQGLMAGTEAHLEAWTAFVRAGASIIITYGARHAREWLLKNS